MSSVRGDGGDGERSRGRHLIVVLGDQLDERSSALADVDAERDVVLMMEVAGESRHVPSHKARTVLFLSAMRHFAESLRARGLCVRYVALDDPDNTHSFGGEIARAVAELTPRKVIVVEPGEFRARRAISEAVGEMPLEFRADAHFLTTHEQFADWAEGRKELTMEYFYREQRRRLGILMEPDGKTPLSGRWNYDHDNREAFGKSGPSPRPRSPKRFEPDAITRDVMRSVDARLPELPGTLEGFAWPVTRAQALAALEDFVKHRLANFGPFEDAMWTGEPTLFHSTLSCALNLKLLSPRECVDAALAALDSGRAPLQSVEAFIRQIIGWREYIRGVYVREGEGYQARNSLGQYGKLPSFYWTGDTDLNCLRHCIGQVVRTGFAHHIQRLMVMGNFALIAGVHPREVSDWYLAMYVDAVDWVTLPNALGMVMHADGTDTRGPVVGTKPYAASGQYISRMSNYCKSCKYDPAKRTGADACPFTVFYWDFLNRHRERFRRNHRMAQILANLDRFGGEQLTQITVSARRWRDAIGVGDPATPRQAADLQDWSPPRAAKTGGGLFQDQ